MREPKRPVDDSKVIDLKARRRVAELRKQALKGARESAPPRAPGPLAAWAILLAVALAWALVRWIQA